MDIRPNPKLRVLYIVMLFPIASVLGGIFMAHQALQPLYRDVMWRNLFLSLLMVIAGVVSWKTSLEFAQTFKQFFEAYQAVKRGELTLRMELTGLAELQEMANASDKLHQGADVSLVQWIHASQENHRAFLRLVQAISEAVDARDFYMRGHSGRVTDYSIQISKQLGLPQTVIERIRLSALLHDIGKIGIDDRIVNKRGILTNEEFELMKSHPTRGAEMLQAVPELADIIPGVRWHHESLDGRGYPDGLKGDEIPQMARIIAVADTFDAMTTHRPYQDAMKGDYAVRILQKLSGTKFDPVVVQAFCSAFDAGDIHLPLVKGVVEQPEAAILSA